jgi:hypothetical protein
MDIIKDDRVGYTVMYGTRPNTRYVTEFGRVTSMWPPDAPSMARIAVEDAKPGRAKYVTRKLRDIELAPLSTTPLADALAAVDRVQAAGAHMTVGTAYALTAELPVLRKLAEAVRAHLLAHPERG